MDEYFARRFYKSTQWIKCRTGYMLSQNYICEICGNPGEICHHKTHLTPENIGNPDIALNWERLQCVCLACHNQIHKTTPITREGLIFDESGNLQKV